MARLTWLAGAIALGACGSGSVDMSKGGTELTFEVEVAPGADEAQVVERARVAMAARLKAAEIPARLTRDGKKIMVGLPKRVEADGVARAKELLSIGGRLEIREVAGGSAMRELGGKLPEFGEVQVAHDAWTDPTGRPQGTFLLAGPAEAVIRQALATAGAAVPAGIELLAADAPEPGSIRLVPTAVPPALAGDIVQGAAALRDPLAPVQVQLLLTPEAAEKLQQLTTRILGRKMALVLDGQIVSWPIVMEVVTGGKLALELSGNGERKVRERQAELIALALRSGAIPAPAKFVEQREVPKMR